MEMSPHHLKVTLSGASARKLQTPEASKWQGHPAPARYLRYRQDCLCYSSAKTSLGIGASVLPAGCNTRRCAPRARSAQPLRRRLGKLFAMIFESATAETLTYKDLVRRLTDMEHLAVLPPAGERGGLASSYDRKSKYDETSDRYIAWDANGDGDGIIRKEGETVVLADIQGPGCIWRTWSAAPRMGHVKLFLDGQEIPAVDLPFKGYFDGENEPFTRPNLVYCSAKGWNNFTPIPFQKSCKIVADPKWGAFYHFNYTNFAPGTVVPTFKLPLPAEDLAALDEASRLMGQFKCDFDWNGKKMAPPLELPLPATERPGQKNESITLTIPAGKKVTVLNLDGPQAITGLQVNFELPKDVTQQLNLLAQLTISATWDDEDEPAVWSPLGDFFGAAAGAVPVTTVPAGLTRDGTFYCFWYMPFHKSARLEIGNDSPQPVTMTWKLSHAPLDRPVEQLGRFHAKWHRDAFLPKRKDREIDWTLLTTQGKGRYVGTQLHVWNPHPFWTWWGEGDEKFFVDGEKFPSTFGTGSEDYFGYGWCGVEPFCRALHSISVAAWAHKGHESLNRWHIADNIPFETSFEGSLEKYFPNGCGTLYAAVAFWYLNSGGKDPYTAVPVAERVGWWKYPDIYREAGVIEAESLERTGKQNFGPAPMWEHGLNVWSGNFQGYWNPTYPVQIGEKIDLKLPPTPAGKYRVIARFTKSDNYGVFQVSVAGQKVGPPVDLYARRITAADPCELGTVDLPAGDALLTLEVLGKNPASSANLFGMDYIKLVPVP